MLSTVQQPFDTFQLPENRASFTKASGQGQLNTEQAEMDCHVPNDRESEEWGTFTVSTESGFQGNPNHK